MTSNEEEADSEELKKSTSEEILDESSEATSENVSETKDTHNEAIEDVPTASEDEATVDIQVDSEEANQTPLEETLDVIQEVTSVNESNIGESEVEDQKDVPADSEDFQQELLEFADLDGLDDLSEEDLKDMEDAIADNVQDAELVPEGAVLSEEGQEIEKEEFKPEIDDDLEAKMQEELAKKRKAQGVKTITKEVFIEYLSERRTKIVYHALWYLAFDVDDHEASKAILYDALKDVTSKNAVEPLEEHKFYFGLGFILRLKLFDQKVIQFKNGKLKVMVNPENLQDILNLVGDPISERPILTSNEKETMFTDFLKDDFLDI